MTPCAPLMGIRLGHVTCFVLWDLSGSEQRLSGSSYRFPLSQGCHVSNRVFPCMADPAVKKPRGTEPQPLQPTTYNA